MNRNKKTKHYRILADPLTLNNGKLAWRQHDGGHNDAPICPTFLAWANRHIHGPPAARCVSLTH